MYKKEVFQIDDDIDLCFDVWTIEWLKAHPRKGINLAKATVKEQSLALAKKYAINTRAFGKRMKARDRYYQGKKISFQEYCTLVHKFQGEKLSILESKELYGRFLYTLENEITKLDGEIKDFKEQKLSLESKEKDLQKQAKTMLDTIEKANALKKENSLNKFLLLIVGMIVKSLCFVALVMGVTCSITNLISPLLIIPFLGMGVPLFYFFKRDIKHIKCFQQQKKFIQDFDERQKERDQSLAKTKKYIKQIIEEEKECNQKLGVKENNRNRLLIERAHYKIIYNYQFEKKEYPFDLDEKDKVKVLK